MDNRLGHRQSQTAAERLADIATPVRRVKDMWQIGLWDTNPGVNHPNAAIFIRVH